MDVPSFTFELRIIQARNVESTKSTKNLFARLYLPAGNNNRRIQLNSKKAISSSRSIVNESFSLECSCPQEFLETLKEQSIVLELREKSNYAAPAVLRRILGSSLVGKGEIPWKAIMESPNMELKKWVKMGLVSDYCKEDAPEVQVEIKIQVKENNRRRRRLNNLEECGCKNGHDQHAWCSAEDYDLFALGALEAF